MTGSKLIGIVVALVAIGAGAYFLFPGFRTTVNNAYDKHAGWNEEARRKDPVGFTDYSIQKLTENIDKFEGVRVTMSTTKSKLEEGMRSNKDKMTFAQKQLDEFKVAYKAAAAINKWPVSIAGKNYSENDRKSQVDLILGQKATYESISKSFETNLGVTEKKYSEIVNRVSESKSKLEFLKSQRELLKASQVTKETEKILSEVNDVLVQNEALAAGTNIRTVEELMKESNDASAGSHPNADAFLKN